MSGPGGPVQAYAFWVSRWARPILLGAAALSLGAAYLASQLPVHADFSYLLPPAAESVRHLRALETRARVLGTVMLAVESTDPNQRAGAAQALHGHLAALGPQLVSNLIVDARVTHDFVWDHRWLFVPLDALQDAHHQLKNRLEAATLRANPLFLDFETPPGALPTAPSSPAPSLQPLRDRLAAAEAAHRESSPLVGKDGRLQMMILNTPFAAADGAHSGALLAALHRAMAAVQADYPQVKLGMAGDIVSAHEEQGAILQSMAAATLLTVLLVVGALYLYYRTWAGVMALFVALAVGTLSTFAVTRLSIGHLNLATAFLSSIVMGNGINFGIMVLARHLEARRAGASGDQALGLALEQTLRGTCAAALTAATAYLSLVVTDFRGFRHFGIIGGVGMLLCWISAYTVLPACLALLERRGWLQAKAEPALGARLAKLLPQHAGWVVRLSLATAGLAVAGTYYVLSHDPYEANFKNLRSDNAALRQERHWMQAIDKAFGQGISGGFVIGLPNRAAVAPLVARLRAMDAGKPEHAKLFSRLGSLDDMLPTDQPKKLALLAAVRALLTDANLRQMDPDDRALAQRLRPPANLQALTDQEVPQSLAWPFIERDGSRGKLVLAMSGWGFEVWDAHDLVRFADTLRALKLGDGVLLGGSAFVFSDMLRMVERDGPRATLAAMAAATAAVVLVIGPNLYAGITLACGALGTLLMLSLGGALGLRINFLDFVALPITVGIGIDYAANICVRAKLEGRGHARRALRTAGGAVFLSSYTTVVGYGSLLLSANQGIRSFGAAAVLGELTCLVVALICVPAGLEWLDGRAAT
jgi:predicted exporter